MQEQTFETLSQRKDLKPLVILLHKVAALHKFQPHNLVYEVEFLISCCSTLNQQMAVLAIRWRFGLETSRVESP